MNENNMELGNAVFGNSRGEYPLERDEGFEEEIFRLFDRIYNTKQNGYYGIDFENDTFTVMPYYWGDCTCGYDDRESEWCENNYHRPECYYVAYKKIAHYYDYSPGKNDDFYEKHLKPLYQKFGLPTEGENWWAGYAAMCNCDYSDRWDEFMKTNGHSKDCPIVKPNFLYKPTDFEIQWYKYPFRDSYTNQPITLDEFRVIIDSCIKSVK